MAKRVLIEVGSIFLITLALAVVGAALILGGGDPFVAFPDALRFLLGPTGIALGVWAALLIGFSIGLHRRPAWLRAIVHLGSLVVANIVNFMVLTALAWNSVDSWVGLVLAISLAAGAGLFAAAIVAVSLTEFVFLRRLDGATPAAAVEPSAPAAT